MHLIAHGPHHPRYAVLKVLLNARDVTTFCHEFDTDQGWAFLYDTQRGKVAVRRFDDLCCHTFTSHRLDPRPPDKGGQGFVTGCKYFGKVEVLIKDTLSGKEQWFPTGPNPVTQFNKFPVQIVDGVLVDA
jgi:hypothetical protein